MRKWINSLMIAVVSLGLTAGLARGDNAKDELESRAHSVNALADKHGGMKDAIHASRWKPACRWIKSRKCTINIRMPAPPES